MNEQVFVNKDAHYVGHLQVIERQIFKSPEHEEMYRRVHWSAYSKPRPISRLNQKRRCRVRLKEVHRPAVSLCFIPKSNHIISEVPIAFATLAGLDDFLKSQKWERIDLDEYRARSGHTPLI